MPPEPDDAFPSHPKIGRRHVCYNVLFEWDGVAWNNIQPPPVRPSREPRFTLPAQTPVNEVAIPGDSG